MSPMTDEEETLLLTDEDENAGKEEPPKQKTPLPWHQLSILLLLQGSEPLTSVVIAPFLPQLIKDTGITGGNDSSIAYYAGLLYSLFFLTEACTVYHWSRISDQIGRRPVLLVGIFSLSASMWCFGFSKTFPTLVLSRCLNGALNGNIGVMKGMMIELTDSTNIADAYSVLPLALSSGNALGPLIGGSLARPADTFPAIFGHSAFFKKYPYFLPCAVVASFTALSWLIAILFLKETAKPRMRLGQWLLRGRAKDHKAKIGPHDDIDLDDGTVAEADDKPVPFRALLIRPVVISAGCYAMYSLVDVAFRAVLPVYYALPIEMGGLSLDPRATGIILACFGISGGILRWLFFASIHDWLGPKTMYLASVSSCLPMVVLFPVINIVARAYGLSYFVWFLVGLQVALFVCMYFSYAINFMYIGAATPNKASIGATNGLAQIVVSVMRAVGPATVNSAFSLSIENHILGGYFVYWVMTAMVVLALWVGSLLPKQMWKR